MADAPYHETAHTPHGKKRQCGDAEYDQRGAEAGSRWHRDADARGQRDVSGHTGRALGQQSQRYAREEPAGDFTSTPHPRRGPAHMPAGSRVGGGADLELAAGVWVHACALVELQLQAAEDFGWVIASTSTSGQYGLSASAKAPFLTS